MKIVLASGNVHKVAEIKRSLPQGLQVVTQTTLSIPPAEETGLTFVENALIKARHAASHSGLPAIADDSGLEVDYLNGEPGVRSARYAGTSATDDDNNVKLLAALADVKSKDRSARFRSVIVMVRHAADPFPLIASGSWEGSIAEAMTGDGGFGYDPLFIVSSLHCTAAELEPAVKDSLSHRGQALAALKRMLEW